MGVFTESVDDVGGDFSFSEEADGMVEVVDGLLVGEVGAELLEEVLGGELEVDFEFVCSC